MLDRELLDLCSKIGQHRLGQGRTRPGENRHREQRPVTDGDPETQWGCAAGFHGLPLPRFFGAFFELPFFFETDLPEVDFLGARLGTPFFFASP